MLPNEIKYRYKINLMINDEGRKESTVNVNSNLYANKTFIDWKKKEMKQSMMKLTWKRGKNVCRN